MEEYIAPKFKEEGFHCPHCETYAHQKWDRIIMWDIPQKPKGVSFVASPAIPATFPKVNPPHGIATDKPSSTTSRDQLEAHASVCSKCHQFALWVGGNLVYPSPTSAPLPSKDMPLDVKEDYLEARKLVDISPRSAESLLRLALQKLMPHLGESGENLNDDIGNLVKRGLPSVLQESLDSIRIIGNNAVHPGTMVLRNDKDTALLLFKIINKITEKMITEQRELEDLYKKLPNGAKEAIARRDAKK